jgi:flavodoxin
VADELQRRLNADTEAIELVDPYPEDYDLTIDRCRKERDEGIVPQVKPLKSDLSQYQTIFLGYPIWFGTYALPIAALVKDVDFAGKNIIPFCTFGSGGLESSVADLRAALPKAVIADGYGVRNARLAAMPAELNRFLIEHKYIDGQIEALPEYSEQQPVTDAERSIFDAACSGYKFPLGTPVSSGTRTTADGTDYKFYATSTTPDGESVTATIYITVSNDPAVAPEFTRVVR